MPWMRMSCSLLLAISLASFSSAIMLKVSPAVGAPLSPSTETGVEGPATSTFCPLSLNIALMRPVKQPESITSPTFIEPFCTSTVARYPRPLSSEDSITAPVALRLGLALRSSKSASSSTLSSSRSTLIPFFAEISWHWYFPPQSSTRMFILESCSRILSGFAPGLSILLMANTIGTPAACAWLIASTV